MTSLYAFLCVLTVSLHTFKPYHDVQGHNHAGGSLCSAVAISPNEVLTAGHCVEGTTKGFVKLGDGKSYPATIEGLNTAQDLALLRIDGKMKHWADLGQLPRIGDKVYGVNFEMGLAYTYTEGVVENVAYVDEGDPSPTILSSFNVMPGASGSGLFDNRGKLVGITVAAVGSGSCAVNTNVLKEFLQAYRHR